MAPRTRSIAASAAVLLMLASGAPMAAGLMEDISVTGNAAVTSNYVFRGITFSDDDPAVQGGADVSHSSGLYTGVFLSTVDMPFGASYNQVGGEEDIEYDLYAGWARQFGPFNDYGIDVGVINYGFADNPDDVDWSEAYIAGSWRWFSLRYQTYLAGMRMGDYYRAAFRYTFLDRYTLNTFVGLFDLDRELRFANEYTHYGVGVSTDFKGFNFDLTYHDTDDDGDQRYLDAAGSKVVLTITKRFNIYP